MRTLLFSALNTLIYVVVLLATMPAAVAIMLNDIDRQFSTYTNMQYLEDPTGKLTLEDIQAPTTNWQTLTEQQFNQGYNPSTWWLKFTVDNNSRNIEWLIEIAYPVLDHLNLFIANQQGDVLTRYAMGDKRPFWERPFNHRYFIAPLQLSLNESKMIYLQVASSSSIQVPITIWEKDAFIAAEFQNTLLSGFYFGALLLIIACNLLLYLALSERAYLYYIVWASAIGFFWAALDGWAFQYLWPAATQWNDQAIIISLAVIIIFGGLSSQSYLAIYNWSTTYNWTFYTFLGASILIGLFALIAPYSIMIRLVILTAIFGILLLVWSSVHALIKGIPDARYSLIAWGMVVLGSVLLALRQFHLIPDSFLVSHSLQLGALLQVVILSFGLAARYARERNLRAEAQQLALETQIKANETLETRVAERTQELEEANIKLQTLSSTDQLTNLKNRRFLDEFLEKAFNHGAHCRQSISILLIDVDHFKQVNDTYGHQVGDDCLQAVAQRLIEANGRTSDLVARYGGEEFCVVMPQTNLEGAMAVAERIRSNIATAPINTRDGALAVTISIGVYAGIPTQEKNQVIEFLAMADQALYRAKQEGRNRVVNLAA